MCTDNKNIVEISNHPDIVITPNWKKIVPKHRVIHKPSLPGNVKNAFEAVVEQLEISCRGVAVE